MLLVVGVRSFCNVCLGDSGGGLSGAAKRGSEMTVGTVSCTTNAFFNVPFYPVAFVGVALSLPEVNQSAVYECTVLITLWREKECDCRQHLKFVYRHMR